MPKETENSRQPEKQGASSSEKKGLSSRDFAAGKPYQGIDSDRHNRDNSNGRDDIQNRGDSKKRKVTFNEDQNTTKYYQYQGASSSGEKEPLYIDLIAGNPLSGILTTKPGNIERDKGHEDIHDRDPSQKANLLNLETNQFSDQIIEKHRNTIILSNLQNFKNTLDNIYEVNIRFNEILAAEHISNILDGRVNPMELLQLRKEGNESAANSIAKRLGNIDPGPILQAMEEGDKLAKKGISQYLGGFNFEQMEISYKLFYHIYKEGTIAKVEEPFISNPVQRDNFPMNGNEMRSSIQDLYREKHVNINRINDMRRPIEWLYQVPQAGTTEVHQSLNPSKPNTSEGIQKTNRSDSPYDSFVNFIQTSTQAAEEHLGKLQQLAKEHSEKLQQPKRAVE